VEARLSPDLAPEETDFILYAPGGPLRDFSPYVRARAVLSLWAGVERILGEPTLTQPLVRMVEDGLRQQMREWVAGQVLRHHLGLDAHIRRRDPVWNPVVPPPAPERPVTVLGLGVLGGAAAATLAQLGFPVTGWSRSQKALPGLVRCLAGPEQLSAALRTAQILVLLLPLTPETENLLDARRLAELPRGAVILNPGRGALIDDAALIAALDSGQVGHATLDTFRQEPLPPDHPFWFHPRITVSPHVAAETRPATAAQAIAANIARSLRGEPLMHLVDRRRGY
jgi:glyoxylate/hydroxypyruvate reductase A